MSETLRHARDLWGVMPACVVDVGAAQGKWSILCAEVWPEPEYRLVEPLRENREALARLTLARPGWHHVESAAGAEAGEVAFSVTPDLDGSAIYEGDDYKKRTVPVMALDSLEIPPGNCLLKLDTHGYEVPILNGAVKLLERTTLLIVEVYGQRITSSSLLFYELCAHVAQLGFRPADLVDVMKRPADKTLWQADLFFLRADNPVFSNHYYTR